MNVELNIKVEPRIRWL